MNATAPSTLLSHSATHSIERAVILFLICIFYIGAPSGRLFSTAFLNQQCTSTDNKGNHLDLQTAIQVKACQLSFQKPRFCFQTKQRLPLLIKQLSANTTFLSQLQFNCTLYSKQRYDLYKPGKSRCSSLQRHSSAPVSGLVPGNISVPYTQR